MEHSVSDPRSENVSDIEKGEKWSLVKISEEDTKDKILVDLNGKDDLAILGICRSTNGLLSRSNASDEWHAGLYECSGEGAVTAVAGHLGDREHPNRGQYLLYSSSRSAKSGEFFEFETGVYRGHGRDEEGNEADFKLLTGGVEGGSGRGRMVRVNVGNADFDTKHFGVGLGIGFDTGVVIDNGVEAKILGTGAKVGKQGGEISILNGSVRMSWPWNWGEGGAL